jgi:hypothetical protein
VTGALLGEAVGVLFVTCRALAAWLVAAAFVVTVCLYTAILTGAWATRKAWHAVRGPHQPPPANLPLPVLIASRRRPQPSWGLPSDLDPANASHSPRHEKEHIA